MSRFANADVVWIKERDESHLQPRLSQLTALNVRGRARMKLSIYLIGQRLLDLLLAVLNVFLRVPHCEVTNKATK